MECPHYVNVHQVCPHCVATKNQATQKIPSEGAAKPRPSDTNVLSSGLNFKTAPADEHVIERVEQDQIYVSDVDDTLVMWSRAEDKAEIVIPDPFSSLHYVLTPNVPMIEMLKTKHARGCYTIVWSQSGEAWAHAVVKALGIEQFVHQTMGKPTSYGDDLPAEAWMTNRVYLKPDSKWRNNEP